MVECDVRECNEKAIMTVVCNGIDTIVCQKCGCIHLSHFQITFIATRGL